MPAVTGGSNFPLELQQEVCRRVQLQVSTLGKHLVQLADDSNLLSLSIQHDMYAASHDAYLQ